MSLRRQSLSGLYIHIPFCVRKCVYCDFYSLETSTSPLAERLKEPIPDQPEFMEALERELATLPNDFRPATIFIGGGTPTESSDHDFHRLFEIIDKHIDCQRVREWTCESNPGTLTETKTDIMIASGVNRVSLGVQTFSPRLLEFLGRIHDDKEALAGFHMLRDKGFQNINLDFIYGIPGSSLEDSREDAMKAVALKPDHLSFYCLMIEEGTPLNQLHQRGYVREEDGERQREEYETIKSILLQGDYQQYELSNFSQPGRACLHNQLYWQGRDYLGCGPGAHSRWGNQRWSNQRNLKSYAQHAGRTEEHRDHQETLDVETQAQEALIFGLRQNNGIRLNRIDSRYGTSLVKKLKPRLASLEAEGMISRDQDKIKLTEQAQFISDHILSELV